MRVQANGIVRVYASSGGSGDVINVTVENLIPLSATAVFTDSKGNVTTANSTGETTLAANAEVLGPLVSDIDGDGSEDIPYVPAGGTVHIVNPDGTDETELSSNGSHSPSLLGVGQWNNTRMSVYFASGATIYRTNPSEGDVDVVNPDNGVTAVAGPADIDGDGTNELVYADGSSALRYFEPGTGPRSATGTTISLANGIGSDSGIGLGRPADFDGDGTARIPVVDGSNRLVLVNSTGSETVLVDSGVDKAPVAAVDWDNDGELEIMYLDGGNLKYVDDIAGSPTVKDTGIGDAEQATGVT